VLSSPPMGGLGIPNFSVFILLPTFFNDSLHPISLFRLIVQPLPTGRRVLCDMQCRIVSFSIAHLSHLVSSSFSRIRVTFIPTPSSSSLRSFSLTICRHKLFSHWYRRSYNRVHLWLFGYCLFLLH